MSKFRFGVRVSRRFSRREWIVGLGTLGTGAFLIGCGGRSGTTSPASDLGGTMTQPVPAGPMTSATVAISSTQNGTIPASFAGLSYEKGALAEGFFTGSNSVLINLFKRLGTGVLRIGGNSVDTTNWNGTGAGSLRGQTSPPDVDLLAAFASAAGWPVLYGVNLAQSTPPAAAAEVAYAAKALGSNLLGIEIGNEPDLYPGKYFASSWAFSDYLTLWQSFATAIRAQTPGVALTGPVTASSTTWFGEFAQAQLKNVVLLSMHYYRGNGNLASSTIDAMLSYPDTKLQNVLQSLKAAASNTGVPFRMAETNSFYNGGSPNVSNTYASALWAIDHMFTIAQGGGAGVNFHGGGNGNGYTPIADSGGSVVGARPEYYGLLLFTMAGQGPLLTTTIDAGSLNASAYAVENSAKQVSAILVNKDSAQNLQFTATLPSAVQSAKLQVLTGPSLSATTGMTIQGNAVNADGSFAPQAAYELKVNGSNVTGYVPAASAALLVASLS